MMELSSPGLHIWSNSTFLTKSLCQCPLLACSLLANSTTSLGETHSTQARALVRCPVATLHSSPPSIMYSEALWHACFCFHRLVPWSSLTRVSMTSKSMGTSLNCSLKVVTSPEFVSATWNRSCVIPAVASQSLDTVHLLLLPSSQGVPSAAWLSLSATTLMHPGTCHTSMIW